MKYATVAGAVPDEIDDECSARRLDDGLFRRRLRLTVRLNQTHRARKSPVAKAGTTREDAARSDPTRPGPRTLAVRVSPLLPPDGSVSVARTDRPSWRARRGVHSVRLQPDRDDSRAYGEQDQKSPHSSALDASMIRAACQM